MKTSSSILLFLLTTLLISCSSTTNKKLPGKINELSWLIGRWENKAPEGMLSETWAKQNDSTFTGESYYENQGDTVFSEKIRIEEHLDGLFYIPTVSNQNDGKPVSFKLIKSGKSKAVFENKQHEFPQKITYSIAGDSITAEISGMRNGAPKSEIFVMRRSD